MGHLSNECLNLPSYKLKRKKIHVFLFYFLFLLKNTKFNHIELFFLSVCIEQGLNIHSRKDLFQNL